MLNAVIRAALRYRVLVLLVSLALLVYGGYLATRLPIDVLPDLDRPRVVLITECPGLAAEEVETLVARRSRRSARRRRRRGGAQPVGRRVERGLRRVRLGHRLRAARQTVQERLTNLVGQLPAGVRPQMTPTGSILGQIVIAGLSYRDGPTGGELAPVGKTGLLAERTPVTPPARRLAVWTPVDRHRPADWTPVPIARCGGPTTATGRPSS
ncbi:MAG: efflux RND transporter permease subunit [Gemmataceae bacterium]